MRAPSCVPFGGPPTLSGEFSSNNVSGCIGVKLGLFSYTKGHGYARRKAFLDQDGGRAGARQVASCRSRGCRRRLGHRIELRRRDRNGVRQGARFCASRCVYVPRHSLWRVHQRKAAFHASSKTRALERDPKLPHVRLCQPPGTADHLGQGRSGVRVPVGRWLSGRELPAREYLDPGARQ